MPSTPKGHRTEEAFLGAARQCFASLGYLNTKIADIAQAAGRSTASFYNYYDNNKEIMSAIPEKHIPVLYGELLDALHFFEK